MAAMSGELRKESNCMLWCCETGRWAEALGGF